MAQAEHLPICATTDDVDDPLTITAAVSGYQSNPRRLP